MSGYLIFGGTGSLGKKLIDRLLPTNSQVSVYSRDEAKHWTIANELKNGSLSSIIENLRFYVGDIRDKHRISEVIRQVEPDYIIIAAALKQVDTCELSPNESIQTNLNGTQNVIDAINDHEKGSHKNRVAAVLFVSTDKACAPVNVYGMCKAISERIVTSQAKTGHKHVKYLAVRYGNVLESRGSIIPLFKYQSESAQFLTVTDPDMTRFVMTLDDSVDLILHTIKHGISGQTWIPRLPAMRIGDLAELFSERSKKQLKIIGLRPGEKMHEDLINESESYRTCKNDTHCIIDPSYVSGKNSKFTYSSSDSVMTKQQLNDHLVKLGIFDMSLENFSGLKIEEIVTNRTR
jgi:FlaA1/EpsC-like NDP-sugar epimerase